MNVLYSHSNSVTCVHVVLFCFVFFSLWLVIFVDDSEAADLWLLNSCTVKNPSEDNFRNAIKRAQELDKHLVVAGCVPQGQPKHQSIKGISVIGVCTIIKHCSISVPTSLRSRAQGATKVLSELAWG